MRYIATIRMGPKGEIVLPAQLRKKFKEGEELAVIREKDSLVLKKVETTREELGEDLELARR